MARRLGAPPSHTWRALLGLRIKPVINRQICSNPSARQKIFLKLSIPLVRISGTRIIGSMVPPFFFYLTPLIFLHSPLFPDNLPSRVWTQETCFNRHAGMLDFGPIRIGLSSNVEGVVHALARWWLLGHTLYGRSDVATERFEGAAHGGDRCFVILPSCGGAEACFAHHQLLLVCCCNTPARHQHHLAPRCPIELGHLDNDLVVNRRRP